jgi:Raf kinase inhibitor-like YbhB/YbcL family protein
MRASGCPLLPVATLLGLAATALPAQENGGRLNLTSTAFEAGRPIPKKYTCEGTDTSPPLAWTGAPPRTRSFALIVDDPDAPDPKAPRMTWVHWVVYDIPANTNAIEAGASSARLPAGSIEGGNDFRRVRFGGPCPPVGRHRYFHKLYALDIDLPAGKPLDKSALLKAIEGHVLAQAELVGTYQKGDP